MVLRTAKRGYVFPPTGAEAVGLHDGDGPLCARFLALVWSVCRSAANADAAPPGERQMSEVVRFHDLWARTLWRVRPTRLFGALRLQILLC